MEIPSTLKVIILDCDDTNTNTHGQQELSLFNHYYDEHCYMPLHNVPGSDNRPLQPIYSRLVTFEYHDGGMVYLTYIAAIHHQYTDSLN